MAEFVLIAPDGSALGSFNRDDPSTLSLSLGGRVKRTIPTNPGEAEIEAIARAVGQYGNTKLADCRAVPMELPQRTYYPRMARPELAQPDAQRACLPNASDHTNELASLRGQLVTLMRMLEEICQTVHPGPKTFETYGHAIRNLIILASTEAETHWRAILTANGVTKPRYITNDYVKIAIPMRLGEYAISLPYYPWLAPLRPFAGWGAGSAPTQDLPWYDAYNKVKHDREAEFPEAKLIHAFNAVVGCAVLLIAQFGQMEAFRWRAEFGWFFVPTDWPTWTPQELYVGSDGSAPWVPQNYPFP